jgi:hypothetical protein
MAGGKPAPDLQKMVRRFGTYSNIPAEVWERYDRAVEARQQRRLERIRGMAIESWRQFNGERRRLAAARNALTSSTHLSHTSLAELGKAAERHDDILEEGRSGRRRRAARPG